jgi:hypothetical protein
MVLSFTPTFGSRRPSSHKTEFSFLNGNLIAPASQRSIFKHVTLEEITMSVTKLVVAMGLLLSATSAALAQERQCFGDRPYYGSESAGWLDSNYHPGIDCSIAPPASAHPRERGRRGY